MKTRFILGDVVEQLARLKTNSVNAVVTSPPYHGKMRRYGSRAKMSKTEWAAWMARIVLDCCRISTGPVIVVANGCIQNGLYQPSLERLIVLLDDLQCPIYRPAIWYKNAPPTTGKYFVNDWEFCCAFGAKPVWNWEAIAKPPKFKPGGKFRQRGANGERPKESKLVDYNPAKLARPRDVICTPVDTVKGGSPMFRCLVGGGQLGSKLAHDNEAPYPESVPEPFILSLTNEGDTVLDPFSGSATTGAVAVKHGRSYIGIDNRQSQIDLGKRRVAEAKKVNRSSRLPGGVRK